MTNENVKSFGAVSMLSNHTRVNVIMRENEGRKKSAFIN